MKGKISSMWRMVIALVLIASLSLVAALPVSAASVTQPTVTLSPNTTALVSRYTINFNVVTTLAAANGTISIDFTSYGGTSYVPVDTSWEIGDVTINGAYVVTFAGGAQGTDNDIKFTTPVDIAAGGPVEIIIETTASVKNPAAVGSHTLLVQTSGDSTDRTSKAYIIAGYPGKPCSLYTDKDVFVNSYNTITEAVAAVTAGKTYWTVEVSSDYNSATGPETFPIDVSVEGLTIKSIDGAASTEILGTSANGAGIVNLNAAGVTLGGPDCGFTIRGQTTGTTYAAVLFTASSSNVTVQDNILTGNLGAHAIKDLNTTVGTVMTIKDNVINTTVAPADGTQSCMWLYPKPGSLIDNNDASGFLVGMSTYGTSTSQTGSWANPIVISNNKSYGHYYEGLCADGFYDGATYTHIIFRGNESYSNTGNGINISTDTDYVIVTGNSLYNNGGMGLKVHASFTDPAHAYVFGNNIYGNTITPGSVTTDDYGILNYAYASGVVPADHNWWGDASGPSSGTGTYAGTATGSGDAAGKDVAYTPWLGASILAADYSLSTAKTLLRQSTIGVDVISSHTTTYIGVANYTSNPQGTPEFTALAFFDVYAYAGSWTLCTIKLYDAGVTSSSKAYFWSDTEGAWIECYEQGTASGFVWVNIRTFDARYPERVPVLTDLQGTPFAIGGEAPAEEKGDFNSDGVIGLADFVEFAAAYGSSTGDSNYNAIGDFDDSGDVGLADFVEFATAYGA